MHAYLDSSVNGWICVEINGHYGWVPAEYLGCHMGNLKSYQQLLDLFRHLLGSLVTVGNLLTADELEVGSCKNTASAFSLIENAGDNFLSAYEHEIAKDVFEQLGMTLCDNFIADCAGFLHTNVGLGPFFADALGILDHFTLTADRWNPEKLAGTLEAIFGGLERKGLTNIIKSLVQYGITLVIAICGNGGYVVDTMTAISGRYPTRCAESACGNGVAYIMNQLATTVLNQHQKVLKEKIAEMHQRLLMELIKPPVQFIQEALVMEVPFATASRRECHPTDPNIIRWFLQCVDCEDQVITQYGRSDLEALRGVQRMGWSRAKSSSWSRSSRCPICTDRAYG